MTKLNEKTFFDRTVILEQNKKLSECLLWRVEKEYFEKKGIDAWLHDVPYYITSNPFIAKTYATIVVSFIRDWTNKHPESKNHPFYLMELGTGPGQFSFYMVKALEELRKDFNLEDVSIVYVMSDFAKANIDYYQSHPELATFAERGLLDFAIYDIEKKNAIKLVNSKVELNQDTLVNPLTLFANYVFDTIANDAFSVRDGNLYELLVDLETNESNLHNNQLTELTGTNVNFSEKEIKGSYYKNKNIDGILDLYKKSLKNISFLIPIGSILGLEHLKKIANNKILLISSDKAYSDIASLENLGHPSLTFHGGCFSMMANCHAIGQYFINCDGDFYNPPSKPGLKTCFYTSAFKIDDMPETKLALKNTIEKYSPTDFFNAYRHICETANSSELDAIGSFLQLSEWDPRVYMRLNSRIIAVAQENSDQDTINFIASNIHKIAENYYHMPNNSCIHFEIALFLHSINKFSEALYYYQKAEQYLPAQFGIQYNIGLCFHHLNRNNEALKYFQSALAMDQESKEARDWIEYIRKQQMEYKHMPQKVSDKHNIEADQ